MIYIRDQKTFDMIAAVNLYKPYKLVKSIYTDLSELTVDYNAGIKLGDIIYDNMGYIGVISDMERTTAKTLALKAEDITTLFSRDIIYDGRAENYSAEEYLMSALFSEFGGDQQDPFYASNYLSVNALTFSSSCIPSVEYGLWNVKSYISRIRRLYGIFTNIYQGYNAGRPVLTVDIEQRTVPEKRIFTTHRNVEITEETFSSTKVAKITAYTTGDSPTANNYYLLDNGSYTTNEDDPRRITGEWVYLNISDDQNEQEQVLNKFKENTYNHKISYIVPNSEARYEFYDPVTVELRKKYYQSYIAKVIKHDNGTTEYTCGELRTSLSDKINDIL